MEEVISCFKEALAQITEIIYLTFEISPQCPTLKMHRRKSWRDKVFILSNDWEVRKTACKKHRMVASNNKPLAIDSNILMLSDRDLEGVHSPYNDAIVVKLQISNAMVSWVLMDNRSGVKVLFKDVA